MFLWYSDFAFIVLLKSFTISLSLRSSFLRLLTRRSLSSRFRFAILYSIPLTFKSHRTTSICADNCFLLSASALFNLASFNRAAAALYFQASARTLQISNFLSADSRSVVDFNCGRPSSSLKSSSRSYRHLFVCWSERNAFASFSSARAKKNSMWRT